MSDMVIGGLKGPFTPIPEGKGHGFLGALQYDDVEDKVQCHACGKWMKQVNTNHLSSSRCSGLASDIREYKLMYGFPLSMAIQGEGTREKHIKNQRRRMKEGSLFLFRAGDAKTKASGAKGREAWKETVRRRKRGHTMHEANKKLVCPAQLAHTLLTMKEQLGRLPLSTEIPGSLRAVLEYRYGSFNKALTRLGIDKRSPSQLPPRYSRSQLVKMLQDFKEHHGRPPVASDAKRGLVPCTTTYAKYFGSWSKAKELAGVKEG